MHAFWSNSSNTSPGGVLHSTSLISISGASRDETVPSHLTDTTAKVPTSISILAPVLAKFHSRAEDSCPCGTDHRAIVWCREVLLPVRDLIVSAVSTVASKVNASAARKREHYERTISLSILATKISQSSFKKKPMLLSEMETGPIPAFSEQLKVDEERHRSCLPPLLPFIQSCTTSDSMEMFLAIWVVVGILSLASFPPLFCLMLVPSLICSFASSVTDPIAFIVRSIVLTGAASLLYVAFPSKSVNILHLATIVLTFPSFLTLGREIVHIYLSSPSPDLVLPALIYQLPSPQICIAIMHLLVTPLKRQPFDERSKTTKAVFASIALLSATNAPIYGRGYEMLNWILIASIADIVNTLGGDNHGERGRVKWIFGFLFATLGMLPSAIIKAPPRALEERAGHAAWIVMRYFGAMFSFVCGVRVYFRRNLGLKQSKTD